MRRVAITGIGIVSSIGNSVEEVTASLRNGTSGIVAAPEYTELGFRSQVHGKVKLDVTEHIDRKQLRFMGEGAAYAVLAMEQAIADSGLDDHLVSHAKTGLVADQRPIYWRLLTLPVKKGQNVSVLIWCHAVCHRPYRHVSRLFSRLKA